MFRYYRNGKITGSQILDDRYFSDYIKEDKKGVKHVERKINKDKIKSATVFEDETKNNFEQLFTMLGIPRLDETHS